MGDNSDLNVLVLIETLMKPFSVQDVTSQETELNLTKTNPVSVSIQDPFTFLLVKNSPSIMTVTSVETPLSTKETTNVSVMSTLSSKKEVKSSKKNPQTLKKTVKLK